MNQETVKVIVNNYINEQYADINNVNLGDLAKYVSKDILIKNSRFDKYENICESIKL